MLHGKAMSEKTCAQNSQSKWTIPHSIYPYHYSSCPVGNFRMASARPKNGPEKNSEQEFTSHPCGYLDVKLRLVLGTF